MYWFTGVPGYLPVSLAAPLPVPGMIAANSSVETNCGIPCGGHQHSRTGSFQPPGVSAEMYPVLVVPAILTVPM